MIFWFIIYIILFCIFYSLFEYIYSIPLMKILKGYFDKIILMFPYYQNKLEQLEIEKIKFIKETERSIFKINNIYHDLPENGICNDELYSRWINNRQTSKISDLMCDIDSELDDVISNVIKFSFKSNPFNSDMCLIERQNGAEIINITRQLFHGDKNVVGVITSGEIESILMACLAARNRAYDIYNIINPEIIVPLSAHYAFDKAGAYLNIKIVKVQLDNNFFVDLSAIKLAINKNTIMIVGSYPNFPFGIIDPIDKLSKLVGEYNGRIGLHVDVSSGSFLIPFIDEKYNIPLFDFSLTGVTSLSTNMNKYGNGPKGISVLLYKNSDWRKYQYSLTNCIDGIYRTSYISDSHSREMINTTWTLMMKLGKKGYIEYTKNIINLSRNIIKEIQKINELEILGDPLLNIIAFTFKKDVPLNVYDLQNEMKKRGWFLNGLQNPSALNIYIISLYTQIENFESLFITDLQESIAQLLSNSNINKLEPQNISKIFTNQFSELYFDINYQYCPKYINLQEFQQ